MNLPKTMIRRTALSSSLEIAVVLLLLPSMPQAQDLGVDLPGDPQYLITKAFISHQPGANDPQLGDNPDEGFKDSAQFTASLDLDPSRQLLEGWVTTPGGSRLTLASSEDAESYRVNEEFDSLTSLDSAFPAGDYRMTLTLSDFSFGTSLLNLSADWLPARAQILNLTALQNADLKRENTVRWELAGVGPQPDYIYLNIMGLVGSFETGPLPGTTRHVTFPANVLSFPAAVSPSGQPAFLGMLSLLRVTDEDLTSIPGLKGNAVGARFVSFWVIAGDGSEPPPPPVLSQTTISSDGATLAFNLVLAQGQQYEVESSPDFLNWFRVAEGQAEQSTVTVQIDIDSSAPGRFFRVKTLP